MDEKEVNKTSDSDAENNDAVDSGETTKDSVKVKAKGSTKSNGKAVALAKPEFVNNSINKLDFFNENEMVAAEAFLTKIMRSDKGGIKSVSEGLAIIMRAKDLNLPFSACIEHVHVINGKTGIDIHIIKALLSRAGCTWRCTKDYQPLYEYTDGFNTFVDGSFPDYVVRCNTPQEAKAKADDDKDGNNMYVYPVKWYKDFNGNVYKDYMLNTTQYGIVTNAQQGAELAKHKKIAVYRIPHQAVDYVTEYEITRVKDGEKITATGRFSYSEATTAEMFKKDTYVKYARILIGHRAFTYCAREIASDILFGASETSELKIVHGVPLTNDDVNSTEDTEFVLVD